MITRIRLFGLTFILMLTQTIFAQEINVKGTVTELGTGDPLPGVNVIIKGTNIGAATDFDGNYSIKAKKGDVLEFSFLGYETVTKKVGDNNVINVKLKEGGEVLKAVTINALGIEVKKSSQKAVAISNVKAKALLTSGEHDPVAALSGKVSGVNINLASGDPGASTNITIRGPKSITQSNKPLFVIDGIPIEDDIYGSGVDGVERPSKIGDIDPNNIESIKIIKGGAAAAIWGSRGANGVVIITTKKGKKTQKGKINISINSSYGIDEALTRFPLQETFGQGIGGKYVSNFNYFDSSGSWGDKISERSGDPDMTIPDVYFLDQDGKKWELIFQKNSKETYNEKNYNAVIGKGLTLRNSIQLSTATDKTQFLLGFNKLDQTGIFKNSDYNKTGINYNISIKPLKKVVIKSNFQYIHTKQNAIQKGSNLAGLLLGLYRTPADFDNSGYIGERHEFNEVAYHSQRSYRAPVGTKYKGRYKDGAGYNNPLFTVNEQKNPFKSDHIIGGLNISYNFTDWMKLIAKSGLDYTSERAATLFPVNTAGDELGYYGTYLYSFLQFNTDIIAQFNRSLTENINLDGLVGVNFYDRRYQYTYDSYYDFLLPTVIPNSGNTTSKEYNNGGFGDHINRRNSAYATATFSYKDLLYTTLTGRMERENSYKGMITYPSVSLAFDVANLEYFKDKDNINQITLRAAWSKVGNAPSPYLLDTYYGVAGGGDGYGSYWSASAYSGAFVKSILMGNKDLQPEITTEIEFGTDLKLFKNRLSLNLSYYNSTSDDLILYEKVPAETGFLYKWNNVAIMTNKGLEVEMRYKILNNDNLTWNLGGTYSKNKNTVTKLEGSEYIYLDGFISTSSGVAEGYGFGILRSGDFERDDNGNLVLNSLGFPQKGEKIFAGDPNADFKASLFTDLIYKNLKFRVLFDGSFGGQSWDGTYGALTYFGRTLETANEETVSADDAQNIVNSQGETIASLTNPNNDGTYTVRGNIVDFGGGKVLLDEQWYANGLGSGFGPVGTQFFRDATWIKLRELSLGYTLKNKLISKTKIKSIYFGITGRNLYLWTKDKNWHIDPESNLSGSSKGRGLQYFNHPTTKSIIFTTNINF